MSILRSLPLVVMVAVVVAACGGEGIGVSHATIGTSTSGSGSGTGTGTTTTTSGANVAVLSVNLGPLQNYTNGLFTSVTVCDPGSAQCQTITDVLVDTGSYGFRVLNSALNFTPALQKNTAGSTIGECGVFADGFTWGPVANVNLTIASETANGVPIQIIGSPTGFPDPPAACSNGAGPEEDTLATLAANGILGVGSLTQDCGSECTTNSAVDLYFACTVGTETCTSTTEPLDSQVQNPVPYFATDNNGVIIELPSLASSGEQATASGSLVFGIGTETNNAFSASHLLTTDDFGEFGTTFQNQSLSAFLDTGSNALFFPSSITLCPSPNEGFYCPSATQSLSAVMTGQNNLSVTVPFSVANTDELNAMDAAVDDFAGTTGSTLGNTFDWGMPFFYGRSVYFAIVAAKTSAGVGPYVAF